VPARVEVSWAGSQSLILKSRDVSDTGVFLEGDPEALPPVGTAVTLQVKKTLGGDAASVLSTTVVRLTSEGMGLRFNH